MLGKTQALGWKTATTNTGAGRQIAGRRRPAYRRVNRVGFSAFHAAYLGLSVAAEDVERLRRLTA